MSKYGEYSTLQTAWFKQDRYKLSTKSYPVKREKYRAFSIRAAVRPPYSNRWANPWARQVPYPGVS